MSSADVASPPLFVQLAADPVRWLLMRELAAGDLRVKDLVAAVGQPQNLVSYHVRRLRDAGLVVGRRSSNDGRDVYYRLHLERCGVALAETATALHPGLSGDAVPHPRAPARRVLFLCTGNSGRSPMAEALLRHRSGGAVEAVSAGSRPKPLSPHAVRAMADLGIDLRHEPRHLDTMRRRRFDAVVSLCDRVREVLPPFPGRPRTIHWSLPDPAAGDGTGLLAGYRATAAELDTRIRYLLPTLG